MAGVQDHPKKTALRLLVGMTPVLQKPALWLDNARKRVLRAARASTAAARKTSTASTTRHAKRDARFPPGPGAPRQRPGFATS